MLIKKHKTTEIVGGFVVVGCGFFFSKAEVTETVLGY